MRLNKYTIKIKYDNGYILYSLISKMLIIVESDFFINETNQIDENIDSVQCKYLKDHFIISDDDFRDYDNIIEIAHDFNKQDEIGRFMIHLGYECNLRCSYCYQSNIKNYKKKNTANIINTISKIIKKEKFSELDVCFIGGEPLIYVNDILKISDAISSNIKNKKVSYSVVTNGTLLKNNDILSKLKKYNIKEFQITLDGLKEEHDKFRNDNNKGSFELIIRNLKYIQNKHEDINILINCNISKYNYKNVYKIIDFLKTNDIKYPIFFSLIFDSNKNQNNSVKYSGNIWYSVHKYAINNGHNYLPFYRDMYLGCAMTQSNYYIINPEGKVYSCINGIENDDYFISDNSDNIENIKKIKMMNLEKKINSWPLECKNCQLLPICFGGCDYRNKLNGFECDKNFMLKNEVGIIKEIVNVRSL